MAKKQVSKQDDLGLEEIPAINPLSGVDIETIKALYQYNPNVQWLAAYLGIDESEVIAIYGSYLELLDSDSDGNQRTKIVEFCLYYLATVKKDLRAILAWLEVYDASRYGKASTDVDLHSLKLDILSHLAKALPG
jgi:hypothetical protein